MGKFKKVAIVVLSALMLAIPVMPVWAEATRNKIIGNWEVLVKLNDDMILTRVSLDEDKEYAIKLRDFMTYIGYTVSWNENDRIIEVSGYERIIVYPNSLNCDKDGQIIKLQKPVYIDGDYAYMPMSFLRDVLDIKTLSVDRAETNNRINGIVLFAPNLPSSYRQPYPSPKDTIGGKPLYIDYSNDIKPSLPLDIVFVLLDLGGKEEVIVYSEAMLKDFRICTVKYNDFTSQFSVKEFTSEAFDVEPGMAVSIMTYVGEGIPTEAINFTDSEGVKHSYLPSYGGKDGSVLTRSVDLK